MAERTCVACRRKGTPEEFLRLVADPEGLVHPDPRARLPGRGAWICPTAACLSKLLKKPGVLNRAFQGPVQVDGLEERVRATCMRRVLESLSLAARAGAVVGGSDRLRDQLPRGGFVAAVVAEDASPRQVDRVLGCGVPLQVYRLSLDRAALGRQVGKGSRAVLAVRSGRPSASLIRELRRCQGLGYHPALPWVVARSEDDGSRPEGLAAEGSGRLTVRHPENSSPSAELHRDRHSEGSACPRKRSSTD